MQHYGRTKQAISDELGDYGEERTLCAQGVRGTSRSMGEEEEEDSDSDRGKEVTQKKRSSCYQREIELLLMFFFAHNITTD